MLGVAASRFLLGAVAGWIIEQMVAPDLPGAFPGLPLRPIYGVGLLLASQNYLYNLILVIVLEQVVGMETDLWHYEGALTPYIRLEYSLVFAAVMTAAAYLMPYPEMSTESNELEPR